LWESEDASGLIEDGLSWLYEQPRLAELLLRSDNIAIWSKPPDDEVSVSATTTGFTMSAILISSAAYTMLKVDDKM